MTQEERFNTRDLTYSGWHRRMSTERFIGIEKAELLTMIDIDNVEYDHKTKEPLALIETAQDRGQSYKTATVTLNLAKMANLPCCVALYKLAKHRNSAYPQFQDIELFRMKRLWPAPEYQWRTLTPQEWVELLWRLRK